jgi:hypothetical protein
MTHFRVILLTAFVCLSFFSYGTAMMDYFLVYPSRTIVGADEFVAYHALLENAIIPISVIPFFIITLLNIVLVWIKPEPVSRKLIIFSLVCLGIDWLSTIFMQIPMNLELNAGKNEVLIQHVMDTNWGRVVLESAQAAAAYYMLIQQQRKN